MNAIVNKSILQDYLGCDSSTAHAMMNVIRTKVQTKTIPTIRNYTVRNKNVEGFVFVLTANATDVLKKAQEMLKKTNPKINKPMWEQIKEASLNSINKGLANE